MKSEKTKLLLQNLEDYIMPMSTFLRRYCSITDEKLLRAQISHQQLKEMMPLLERSSFNYILSHPECVHLGKVLLIKDSNKEIVPYVVTEIILYQTSCCEDINEDDLDSLPWIDEEEIIELTECDLPNLSIWELKKLAKYYNEIGQISSRRNVLRELTCRKDSKKSCHRSKERALRRDKKRNHGKY